LVRSACLSIPRILSKAVPICLLGSKKPGPTANRSGALTPCLSEGSKQPAYGAQSNWGVQKHNALPQALLSQCLQSLPARRGPFPLQPRFDCLRGVVGVVCVLGAYGAAHNVSRTQAGGVDSIGREVVLHRGAADVRRAFVPAGAFHSRTSRGDRPPSRTRSSTAQVR
jgi:hypothetical protein